MKNENMNTINSLIVVKRSGQRVNFNSTKIALAIKKAFDQVNVTKKESKINKLYEEVLNYININYADRKTINVEDIQDIIETKLKENNYNDVYEMFNEYRIRRATSRKIFGIKQQHKFVKVIERINENNNENMHQTPNDILLDFGKTISCEYTKSFILDNKFVRAHEEGNIYIHNMDYFNLGKLSSTHLIFDDNINDTFPNDLLYEALNAKCEIDGEICIGALDELLIKLLNEEFKNKIKQNIKHNLKIYGCLEYININKIEEIIDRQMTIYYDISLFDNFILNEKIKNLFEIAYQESIKYVQEKLYKSIKILVKNLDNNYQENKKYSISMGNNNTADGILINNIILDVINSTEYLDNMTLIVKISKLTDKEFINKVTKLIIDNKNIALSFVDTLYNKNKDSSIEYFSNGTRIFDNLITNENYSKGRMLISSVSINLGRLGIKYENKNIKDFYNELDEWLELSKNCLLTIFEIIGDKNKDNYQIIFNNNIVDDEKLESGQKIRKVIKKGALKLELAGLSECVVFLEKDPLKQKELLKQILKYTNKKCKEYTELTKINFILGETHKNRPLKKLMELDKTIYGIRKNINDKEKYDRLDSLFDFKTNIEDDMKYISEYQKLLNGGNLVKINISKSTKTRDIINIINKAQENNVGYLKIEVKK